MTGMSSYQFLSVLKHFDSLDWPMREREREAILTIRVYNFDLLFSLRLETLCGGFKRLAFRWSLQCARWQS